MKNKILVPLLIAGVLAIFFSFVKYNGGIGQSSEFKRVLTQQMVMKAITGAHFSPRPIDDSFSSHVYHRILNRLDYEKLFFTQEDMNTLGKYEFRIDDEIMNNSIEFFDSVDAIFLRRLAMVQNFCPAILEKPFAFNGNEIYDNASASYAANNDALKERWRLKLKSYVLGKYEELKDEQDKKRANKDSANVHFKTDEELEADARDDNKKLIQRQFKRYNKIKDDDRFTEYINAITYNEDPHSDFFPPVQKKNFDALMSGSFVGIGARLNEGLDERITIAEIITGTPSFKQGELKAGDEILKVAQADNTPVDVRGFELDDVVQLIRGEKGSEVRLTVKKPDGTIKVIKIIRDVVNTEETFAKSAIINGKSGPIGYIKLPSFYGDFNGTSHRKSSTDIENEVIKLKNDGVKGIILDLRDNGGGSLSDVVDMAGTFVGKGPVVQVRGNNARMPARALVSNAPDTAIYSGPFIIMVNEGSASASEILAAAMQDYKRAVIVGTPTYGKGTVQKMLSLDDIIENADVRRQLQADTAGMGEYAGVEPVTLGSVKLTMEKFYRVNGGSTQQKGVTPDINLPDGNDFDDEDLGERHNKSSLPWDQIASVPIKPANCYTNLQAMNEMSKSRVQENAIYKQRITNMEHYKKQIEKHQVSLNEKQYKKEQKENEDLNKKMEELMKNAPLLTINNVSVDLPEIKADSARSAKNTEWLKGISKNIDLYETTNIMNDLIKIGTK